MRRLATVFIGFFALAAPAAIDAAAAASAEDVIKGWVGAIPTTPDWKVTYGAVTYDAASDKTTLKGLKATSSKLDLTVGFDTIAITGYAPAADGSFTAKAFTADGGSAVSDGTKLTVDGVVLTDIGSPAVPSYAFDKDHPLLSIVQIYNSVLQIHLGHAGVDLVAFDDPSDDTTFSYSNLAIDNWTGGKIGSMTMGQIEAKFIDPDTGEPVSFQIGGFESHDTDLDAMMRVYDPARYVNGVGDMVWRSALGSASYHDFTIQSTGFDMTLGAWSLENFKVRQPQRPFTVALDKMMANPDADPTPEGMRSVFDLMSSFALGKLSITDLSVDGDDGYGDLAAFTMTDVSAEGIGEIAFDALDVDIYSAGFGHLGRLAAGNIVFPAADKLLQAFETAARDEEPDPSDLATRLGYLEADDVEFDTPDVPETYLSKFRLDLSEYVGLVPTKIALAIEGFDAPIKLFSEDGTDTTLRDLNYDRVRADYGVKLAWHEADQTVTVDDFNLAFADVGSLTGSAVLGGLSRDALTSVDTLGEELGRMSLVSSSFTFKDDSLLARYIAQQAYLMGTTQTDFRKQLLAMIPDVVSDLNDGPFKTSVTAALQTYVARPGTFTVKTAPPMPIPVGGMALFVPLFPESVPDLLGITVSAVAGPAPVDFDYVPPVDDTQPPRDTQPTDSYRHVPTKKQ